MQSISQNAPLCARNNEEIPYSIGGVAPNLDYCTLKYHSSLSPVSRSLPGSYDNPSNWFRSSEGFDSSKDSHFVLKIQSFRDGGYEAVVLHQDLAAIARLSDIPRSTGKRVQGDQDENSVQSSINRTRKRIRHLIKSIGCDRMATFTERVKHGEQGMTLDQWASAWKRFNRLLTKNNIEMPYVSTMEHHKKGNYHMHAAIPCNIPLKTVHKLWHAALGKRSDGLTPGGINVKFKPNLTPTKRKAGIAKYISKYISKQAETVEFNKKRYWASRHDLPACMRYVLNANDFLEAVHEMSQFLSLDMAQLLKYGFRFSDGMGLWVNYDDALAAPPPF